MLNGSLWRLFEGFVIVWLLREGVGESSVSMSCVVSEGFGGRGFDGVEGDMGGWKVIGWV